MRISTASLLSRPALLCAALALGPGCKSVEPQVSRPSDGTTVGQDTGAVSTPESSTPETPGRGTSPWQRARVGDRVTYAFSANRGGGRTQQPTVAVAGVVALEVVAVEAPWVWLSLSFTGDSGSPLPLPGLARSLVVPVRSDVTRPLDVPREGVESTEQPTAAGRTWEAKRYLNDQRMVDGPLQNRLYAVEPGPLYLTNGLLDASTTLSGFGSGGSSQLTLMEARQGSGGGTGTVPALTLPLGPGTWYDVRTEPDGTQSVKRTCLGAERGHVLRQEGTPAQGGAPCPDFAQAEVQPLEEAVLALALDAVGMAREWPPRPAGAISPVRDSVAVGERQVPALRYDVAERVDGTPGLRAVAYAADPWDGALAGLAHETRFQMLSETLYRTTPAGRREPVDSTRLAGWGAWVPGAKP
ncbi:DUF6068 family protein [Myxococcus sp. RHSTA-1-4]|uniref:DUF6068 family protein n=1 Tax=Myxococcus sp. RHSTA-1-4 TaxID=2874601 RepID=UPI001CC0BEE0|nr:DUF6068 family protein [Myxococcus sp. RHSTA-1-4]MBZ4422916.1 DUF6068 family protein [Myxococcus sp. RHSTA-1-4]